MRALALLIKLLDLLVRPRLGLVGRSANGVSAHFRLGGGAGGCLLFRLY
jgi:hypothetical protein